MLKLIKKLFSESSDKYVEQTNQLDMTTKSKAAMIDEPSVISEETNSLVAEKDYSLWSGERQVGRTIDEIRADHINRYNMAVNFISAYNSEGNISIADVFCGNGYGTHLLSKRFTKSFVIGFDGSKDAIDLANECYTLRNNVFSYKLFPFSLPKACFDYITCFESLEHVADDKSLLYELISSLKNGGIAFISVPNQEKHSLDKNPHKFHFRHYTHECFLSMLPENVELMEWYGQDVYFFDKNGVNTFQLLPNEDMCLNKRVHGQVNIYVLKKVTSSEK